MAGGVEAGHTAALTATQGEHSNVNRPHSVPVLSAYCGVTVTVSTYCTYHVASDHC